MKYLFSNWTIILAIILLNSCNQTEQNKNTNQSSQSVPTNESIDTSGYFIKKLLNCSSKEVAKKLGNPDKGIKPSKDCDYLPNCNEATYQNEKYEVLYYNSMLKWIEINNINIFNKNAIQYVGFPASEPTWANELMIHWRSAATRGTATGPLITVKGIRQVSVLPANGNNQGYIIVEVETNYNKKF